MLCFSTEQHAIESAIVFDDVRPTAITLHIDNLRRRRLRQRAAFDGCDAECAQNISGRSAAIDGRTTRSRKPADGYGARLRQGLYRWRIVEMEVTATSSILSKRVFSPPLCPIDKSRGMDPCDRREDNDAALPTSPAAAWARASSARSRTR